MVEIIISHPKAGCLGLVSIEKNAGEWRPGEQINA
jgi:hypothetical protein